MKKRLILILGLLIPALALAGTGNLPQIVTQIIQKAHVNDIRSALSGDLVPRDSTGTVNDNATNLGQASHRWSTVNGTQFCIVYSSGGNAICHAAASAPGSAYTVTWNASLPGSNNNFLQMSTGGAISYGAVDGSTICLSGGTMSACSNGITGSQIQSSVNLPGNLVEENGDSVVVASTNPSTSLKVIRGSINAGAPCSPQSGEGFSCTRNSTGTYTISFTSGFSSNPIGIATFAGQPSAGSLEIYTQSIGTGSLQFVVYNGTAGVDAALQFLIIGPR